MDNSTMGLRIRAKARSNSFPKRNYNYFASRQKYEDGYGEGPSDPMALLAFCVFYLSIPLISHSSSDFDGL
jgi:hypothetical protein